MNHRSYEIPLASLRVLPIRQSAMNFEIFSRNEKIVAQAGNGRISRNNQSNDIESSDKVAQREKKSNSSWRKHEDDKGEANTGSRRDPLWSIQLLI